MLGHTLRRGMPPSLSICASKWWLLSARRLVSTASRKGVDRQIQAIIHHENDISVEDKVKRALDKNLFALAAKFCLDLAAEDNTKVPTHQILFRITSGLALFDPALTPLNLRTLELLHKQFPEVAALNSFDKSTLLNALISWSASQGVNGDIGLVREGFKLASQISPGDPVPVTVLISLVEFAEKRGQLSFLVQLWEYTRTNYPQTCLTYYPILVRIMRLFSRTEKYQPLAREVAKLLLSAAHQDYDPSVLASLARVALKLKDVDLATQLQKRIPVSETSRPALGALLALFTAKKDAGNAKSVLAQLKNCDSRRSLSGEEWSSLVKVITETYGVDRGEAFARKNNRGSRKALADVSICHQAIQDGNYELYRTKLTSLESGRQIQQGILLNLVLEWELRNGGTFAEAKRHYLNRSHTSKIDVKQREIALNTLLGMPCEPPDNALEWAISEARRNNMPTTALRRRRALSKTTTT